MEWLKWIGEHFIGMFQAGGETFMGMFTGIIPTLVVLLTFTYAVIKFIGEERVNRAIQFASKYMLLRYTVMPILSVLLLTNPMCYTFGRFLPEKQKPAFYDSAVSVCSSGDGVVPVCKRRRIICLFRNCQRNKRSGLFYVRACCSLFSRRDRSYFIAGNYYGIYNKIFGTQNGSEILNFGQR
ncbi:sorbitol-specific phosphotransferase system component IIC [Aeribacillus sp. SP014]